jgi:hypothetical protein
LKEVDDFIRENRDKDLYFCPHGLDKPHRLKDYAVPPKMLWCDLDEVDPRTMKIKPTIAIESSPGRFVGLWLVDQPVTEDLNRQLSYFFGADKSGWDFTQVLRVPGTINYKYVSLPRTKILWSNGPEYTLREIQAHLPHKNGHPVLDRSDAAEVFKKWQDKLPRWVRKELVSGKPRPGSRSDMIWKLEQVMLEKGLTTEDIFLLIKASPWNKFAGRKNEDEQLRRELDKTVNNHFQANKVVHEEEEPGLIFRNMAEVEEEEIDWIYYPYLARGELTILEGDPGLGKSYLAQMISKAICDGDKLPSIRTIRQKPGSVVYFDIENSSGSVTKKRLVSNGMKNLRAFVQCEEPFSIDDDDTMDLIYDWMEEHRPTMAVFDTLNTYLGKADAFKGHEAQQAFVRFRELAARFNCCVLVLRHLTKSTRERALYRGQGSIAFAGMARVVMTVGVLPDEPEVRVVAVTKINVAKPPKALTFTIEELPDSLNQTDRSRFVWGEFVDFTSEEIIAPPNGHDHTNQRDAAKEFLEETLSDGPVEVTRLEKMAEARSISRRTLYRAADMMKVSRDVSGFGPDKKSLWSL